MIDIIAKLLPVIILSILFLHKDETIDFSHTILGKLIAVTIILFYITYDILYGIVTCLLVILYYQFDFVEERGNSKIEMINLEGFQEGKKNRKKVDVKKDVTNAGKKVGKAVLDSPIGKFLMKQLNSLKKEIVTDIKKDVKKVETEYNMQIKNLKTDITNFKTDITDFKTDVANVKADINTIKTDVSTVKSDVNNNSADILKNTKNQPKKETSGFTNYSNLYNELKKEENTNTKFKKQFKKQNCQDNELKFKNITVKNEIAPHIFPELKYENEPCNPCSDTCNFSIIEEKIKNEDALMKPVNSNDVVLKLRIPESNTIPSIGVVSEPFSTYK
jgi:hypothetical protein